MSKSFIFLSTTCLIIIFGYLLSPLVFDKHQEKETVYSQFPPSIFFSPTLKAKTIEDQEEYQQLIYPDSKIVEKSNQAITLTSSDNPDVITAWYKERIKEMGIKSTAFSQTNTNGNVFNNLAASNGSIIIEVSIKKTFNQNKTTIELKI